jgi:hypothetical protein
MNSAPSSRTVDPEAILRGLFVGASVNGLRFGVLQLIFEPVLTVQGEPYLNLSSNWRTYARRPNQFTEIDELTGEDPEQETQRAIALRHKQVANVEVLSPWPHLVMTFTDGIVLYLNGKDLQHEPWTAGISNAPAGRELQVIACPGGELAFLLPSVEHANDT